MIYIADKKDLKTLSVLWQSAFGDSESYIDFFMKSRFNVCTVPAIKIRDEIVSALYLLDGKIIIGGQAYSALYIYAAATLPEYRSRGLMAEIIEAAKEIASKRGADFITLVPAEKSLFDYYGRFGFESVFRSKSLELSATDVLNADLDDCHIEFDRFPNFNEAEKLRNRVYGKNYFHWDAFALKYAFDECTFNGGKTALLYRDEALCGYAVYYCEDGESEISELCAPHSEMRALLSAIARDAYTITLELPLDYEITDIISELSDISCVKTEIIDKGMAFALNVSAGDALKSLNEQGGAFFSLALN